MDSNGKKMSTFYLNEIAPTLEQAADQHNSNVLLFSVVVLYSFPIRKCCVLYFILGYR